MDAILRDAKFFLMCIHFQQGVSTVTQVSSWSTRIYSFLRNDCDMHESDGVGRRWVPLKLDGSSVKLRDAKFFVF